MGAMRGMGEWDEAGAGCRGCVRPTLMCVRGFECDFF
jgi:hypothetical protein